MAGSSITNVVVAEFTRALLPLSRLDSVARVDALLIDLGWDLPGIDSTAADLDQIANLVKQADELITEFERQSGAAQVAAVIEMLAVAAEIMTALADLLGAIEQAVDADVIDEAGVREAFVRRLIDYLVSSYIQRRRRGLDAVLQVLGLITRLPQPAIPSVHQPEFLFHVVHWDRLPRLLHDPMSLAETSFGWGAGFDAPPFVDRLDDLVRSIRVPGGLYPQDPELALALQRTEDDPQELRIPIQRGGLWPDAYFESGLSVSPLLPDNPNGLGLAIVPYFFGDWQAEFDLGGGWRLEITGGVDAGIGPALLLHPPIAIDLRSDLVAGDSAEEFRFEAAFTHESPDGEAMVIFGSADSARLDLDSVSFSAAAERSASGDELTLSLDLHQLGLALLTTGGDGFVKAMLPVEALDATFDVGLGWSSLTGFQFAGGAAFDITVPVHRSLGPITLELFDLLISVGDSNEIIVRLGTQISATLLVFAVEVEGFGVQLNVSFPEGGGNLGPIDVSFGIAPPTRVAFAIDGGAVSGAGFVEHVADSDRYVGGLSLDIVAVGVDALAIVDTSLPGDPDGFALFASLSLRFPSIPLGFGFSLSGLGGLLAINRSVDTEALALGLRDGAADAILFPENVERDADLLVAQIDEYFPLLAGNTVVGPVGEIRWGVGDMLVGQLGVAISLPQGLIMVLASIEAVLPDRQAPVLELHLDVLGVLDIEEGSLLIVGSLYDSQLLGVIELSGDTALFVRWLDDPYFVMSVGGFHPGFTPPACVPSVLEELRKMRADIDVGFGVMAAIEAYFAVTSNTVQFGGGFEIEASAEFLLVTYTARGWFDFDVLLRFAPFLILADASAGVAVYADEKEMIGVNLTVHLEGPEPWFASGNASFKFFGIKVKFDFAVGGHAPPAVRGTSDVLALVQAALANHSSWTTQRASSGSAGLVLAGGVADDLIRPDDVLVGAQTVAPLDRRIDRLGETTPLQSELTISSTTLVAVVDGVAGEEVGDLEVSDSQDWFAPAQYDVMADQARLSSPSYEQMTAGVTIGATTIGLPAEAPILAPEGHETDVWTPATNTFDKFTNVLAERTTTDLVAASAAAQVVASHQTTTDLTAIRLAGQSYVAIDSTTGDALSEAMPYAAAVAAAGALTGARVVPAHAGAAA